MSIRPRPSSVLFWLLVAAATAINVLPSRAAAKGDLLLIDHDGKYGYIDRTGKVIVPLQFPYAEDFVDGMARVEIGQQWTYIDGAGQLMNKRFDKPARFQDGFYNVSEGLAVYRIGGEEAAGGAGEVTGHAERDTDLDVFTDLAATRGR